MLSKWFSHGMSIDQLTTIAGHIDQCQVPAVRTNTGLVELMHRYHNGENVCTVNLEIGSVKKSDME